MATRNKDRLTKKNAFTIMELLVVVTIIGLIASIAIPAYVQSRQSSVATKTANDFRNFAEQFNYYNLQTGLWPQDGLPSTIPAGMEGYLSTSVWPKETPLGGLWDYDYDAFGFMSGISIDSATMGDDSLAAVDSLMDDGNLTTGAMVKTGDNRLSYILEN